MQKIISFINDLSTKKFILISVLITSVLTIPITFIQIYFGKSNVGLSIDASNSILLTYFIIIIIGPIIESILIVVISKLVGKFMKNKINITIITAILFSCAHPYIFTVFIPSLILVYSYILYDNKNSKISSFLTMTIFHISYNLMQSLSTELIYSYLRH